MSNKKAISWGWVIFWLIIFWPVGLFLAIRKLSVDKSALMNTKTTPLMVIGWILTIFGGLGFIGTISDGDGGGAFVALLFLIGGIILLRKISASKKLAGKYRRYIQIVVNQNESSIDTVAGALGLSYDAALKDLQDMIDIGYLKDSYIHQGNRQIVRRSVPMHQNHEGNMEFTQGAHAQSKSVRCSGCGANNVVIVGGVSECEYCGTPING